MFKKAEKKAVEPQLPQLHKVLVRGYQKKIEFMAAEYQLDRGSLIFKNCTVGMATGIHRYVFPEGTWEKVYVKENGSDWELICAVFQDVPPKTESENDQQ